MTTAADILPPAGPGDCVITITLRAQGRTDITSNVPVDGNQLLRARSITDLSVRSAAEANLQ